jgi:hypothetical protein
LGGVIVNVDQSVSLADNSAANAVQSVADAVYAALQQASTLGSSAQTATVQAILDELGGLTTSIQQGIQYSYQSLGGVVAGIEQGIQTTLGGVANAVGNSIFNSLNPAVIALSGIAAEIARQIGGLAGSIATAVANVIPLIIGAITGQLNPIAAFLGGILDVLTGKIAGITTDVGTIATTLGGLGTTLDTVLLHYEQWNQQFVESQTGYPDGGSLHKDFSALWQALAGLSVFLPAAATVKVSDRITTTCAGANIDAIKNYAADFPFLEGGFWAAFAHSAWALFLDIAKVIPTAFKYWEELKIDIDQSCPNERLQPTAIVDAVLRGFLTQTQAEAEAAQGNLNRDRLKVLQDLAIQQLTQGQLTEAKYRKIITDADFTSAMAAQGYTPGQIGTLAALAVNRIPVEQLWYLRRRQLIDEPTLKAALGALQYDQVQQDALAALSFRPPNVTESIDGVASQAALQQVGLGELANGSAIPEYVSVAGQNEGLDAETTALRWFGHWNVGSIASYITLYFRGLISIETLTAVMGKNFIPQQLVTTLVESSRPLVQYRTISNMLRIGQIDVQTAGKLLLQHGYSQENAQLLITYAQRPGAAVAAKKAQALHAVSLGIAKREYIDGAISENDYYQILLQHGYTIEGANAEIAVENANQAMLTRKANAQLVVDEYGAGLINQQTALAQLAVLGLTANEFAKYTHRIRAFRAKSAKHPTEAELNDFRKVGIIDADVYTQQLKMIGYTDQVAGWFTEWRVSTSTTPTATSSTPPPGAAIGSTTSAP